MKTLQKSYFLAVFGTFFLVFLFVLPKIIRAESFVVNNEYKTGIGYSAAIPYYKPAIAIPFKVQATGNYKDFEYMLQQSTYIGQSYGFSAISSTPYFDNNSLYPTPKFFEKLKLSILPSNNLASENPPVNPDYAIWSSYGDISQAVGSGSNPTLIEPEIIRDSTRFKWLKFNLENGVNLDSDHWYWLVMYPDVRDYNPEEWKFVVPKFVAAYSKAVGSTDNFGVAKRWQPYDAWYYNQDGDYLGFRIGNPIPTLPSKTPLIIIPGVGGSEFKASKDIQSSIFPCGGGSTPLFYPKDTLIWVNELEAAATGCDDFFDVLKLKADGHTSEYPDAVLNGSIYQPSYAKLIGFLKDSGYEMDKTLFVFPYDWRKDLAQTSAPLDNLITQIKNQTGSSKVDIVAHSMGGLVARNYIKDAANAGNVRKLITLGTPYLGSVEFLKALMYGIWIGQTPLGFNVGVNPTEVNDILQNQPGGFELLPTIKYYDFYDGSDGSHIKPFNDQRDIDNNGIIGELSYSQTKQLLTNLGHNSSFFDSTESFHSLDSALINSNRVETTTIVGSGIKTLGQIKESYKFNFGGIKISSKDEIKVNGDKTVPIYSASLTDPTKNISLLSDSLVYYVKSEHGNLPSYDPTLILLKNIIENNNILPDGVQNSPFQLSGKEVSVHSPVNIHAYDSLGNHTGPLPDGSFEEKIPGSSYDTLEDSKYIWLPEGGNFTIKLEATDGGSFDLDLRNYAGDINTQTTTYQEVPIEKTSKGEIALVENSPTSPQLLLDADGNGIVDKIVDSSSILTPDQAADQKPPVTTVSLAGTQGNNSWYTSDVVVTLVASDDNSGVLKTEYSLDGGFSSQIYTAPFTISKEGLNNLLVKSVDKAGNGEAPQTSLIKIDKSKPVVQISAKPNILWPPQLRLVSVLITGSATDSASGVLTKKFQVVDEYKLIQPVLSDFGQYIKLQSLALPWDKSGRVYTVKVSVFDLAGNTADASTTVIVPTFKPKN